MIQLYGKKGEVKDVANSIDAREMLECGYYSEIKPESKPASKAKPKTK